jgi:signal transduction histidine kinase
MLPKIFNPFFTTKRHGTGLGLAIVNRILLNHSGGIEAANEGNGAIFTVTLPLAEQHE